MSSDDKYPIQNALGALLSLPKMTGYTCEHGNPCEPGGYTDCAECPKDRMQVKYKPVYEKPEK